MILKVSAVKTLRITAVIAILTFLTTRSLQFRNCNQNFQNWPWLATPRPQWQSDNDLQRGWGWPPPDNQTLRGRLQTISSSLTSLSPALRPGRVDNSPYCAKIKRTDTSLLRFIICNKGNDLHLHQIMKHASLILAVMRRIIRRAVSIIIFSLLFSASYLLTIWQEISSLNWDENRDLQRRVRVRDNRSCPDISQADTSPWSRIKYPQLDTQQRTHKQSLTWFAVCTRCNNHKRNTLSRISDPPYTSVGS